MLEWSSEQGFGVLFSFMERLERRVRNGLGGSEHHSSDSVETVLRPSEFRGGREVR